MRNARHIKRNYNLSALREHQMEEQEDKKLFEYLQKLADTGTEKEISQFVKKIEESMQLGSGKEIDLYDQTPRQIRCISRGFRFDRSDDWEKLLIMRELIRQGRFHLKDRNGREMDTEKSLAQMDEYLDVMMEEPEAEQLEIGKLYHLKWTEPDIGFGQGRVTIEEIKVRDDFNEWLGLEELEKQFGEGVFDPGLHSGLFEELKEVDLATRIRHEQEYVEMMEREMGAMEDAIEQQENGGKGQDQQK